MGIEKKRLIKKEKDTSNDSYQTIGSKVTKMIMVDSIKKHVKLKRINWMAAPCGHKIKIKRREQIIAIKPYLHLLIITVVVKRLRSL